MNAAMPSTAHDLQRIATRLASLPEEKQRVFLQQLTQRGVDFASLPIVAGPRAARVPLSYAQKRLWFLWKLDPQGVAYTISNAVRLQGELRGDGLQQAFDVIVSRHEALRTTFRTAEDQVYQHIHDAVSVPIQTVDLTALPEPEREARARILAKEEALEPFDLERGPLMRVTLLRLSATEHVLVVTLHHVIADAWSMGILFEEFQQLYSAYATRQVPQLRDVSIQHVDYAAWQRRWLEAGEGERQLAYWREQLGHAAAPLQLPVDHPRSGDGRYMEACHSIELGTELVSGLNRRAQSEGATLFMVLLAGFQALLHRYTGQQDIRVGVPNANRSREETEGVVGCFVNAQVLRNLIDGRMSLRKILASAREAVLGAQSHQELPFEQLVDALQPTRRLGSNPLFEVMFNHHRPALREAVRLPGLVLQPHGSGEKQAQFDLVVESVGRPDGRVEVSFAYAKELFEPDTIVRMADHYVAILNALLNRPECSVSEVELLSNGEHLRLQRSGVNADTPLQLKIRGFQIELGEIEALLRAHAAVREAVVLAQHDPNGDPHLVAYVVPESDIALTSDNHEETRGRLLRQLGEHVRTSLPFYKVPMHYACVESLPLTPSGKLDRDALAASAQIGSARPPYVAARSSLEASLVVLWEDVLKVKPIGIHDNFFELGGHSLLAVQIAEAIGRGIGRNIPVSQLFQTQSVSELADALTANHERKGSRTLVLLETGGDRTPPLYCLHPGGGQVLGYRNLARSFKGRRPVYGLQSRLFYRDDWVDESIECMAAHYAEEIARNSPVGSINLLGWSAGCVLAVEVSRILQQCGRMVSFLGMVDPLVLLKIEAAVPALEETPQPPREEDQRKLLAWVDQARLRAQWCKLLDLCDAQTRADLLKHFIERGLSGHSVSAGDEYVMLNEAHDLMLNRRYRFRPVSLPAHVWWASASLEARGLSTAPSFGGMHAILRVVRADHMSLVNSTELHCELHSLLEERDAGSQ